MARQDDPGAGRASREVSNQDLLIELEGLRRAIDRNTRVTSHKPSVPRIAVGVVIGLVLFQVILVLEGVLFAGFLTQQFVKAAEQLQREQINAVNPHLTLHPEGPDGPAVPIPAAENR